MEPIFMTNLIIEKVRHLKDISIPLSDNHIRHLILTGKNGSGKTSVLEALANYINSVFCGQYFADRELWLDNAKRRGMKQFEISRKSGRLLVWSLNLIKTRLSS